MTEISTMTDAAPRGTSRSDASGALDLLDRARQSLLLACRSSDTATRHRHAQLAALRGAAAVLAGRRRASGAVEGRDGPHSIWTLLPALAPELAEWAAFFEAVAAPTSSVGARAADDLLRQAETFLDLVRHTLGLPAPAPAVVDLLVPTAVGVDRDGSWHRPTAVRGASVGAGVTRRPA